MNEIGIRIKLARINKGMKQKELAEKMGIKQTAVCRWERGERTPRIETLKRIARALNVSTWELILEIDEEKDGENRCTEETSVTGENGWTDRNADYRLTCGEMRIDKRKLKLIMARQMITMELLAERAGISRQRLYAIQRSENIRPKTVGRIAKVLGVDENEILEDEDK